MSLACSRIQNKVHVARRLVGWTEGNNEARERGRSFRPGKEFGFYPSISKTPCSI